MRAGAGLLCAALAACGGGSGSEVVEFSTPESVLCDPAADVYYVSNVNGAPLAKDGNGYITRCSADGVGTTRWIAGGERGVTLHAPKGMALAGDVLWVADIDALRKFDRTTGAPLGAVEVPGATFLNDVTAAADGTVFVTDSGLDANFAATGSDAIWQVSPGGELTALSKTPDLGHPNGIVARDTGVYVVNWRDGAFFQVDRQGVRMDLGRAPQGQLDGLVRVVVPPAPEQGPSAVAQPCWFATSWAGRCIYRFDLNGRCEAMPVRLEQPADLDFDERRDLLVVPLFGEHRLHAQRL